MAAAMVFAAVSELASENITLTTYYPAPSGVYAQMITTGNTYLARNGGTVGIHTATPDPFYALDVNGRVQAQNFYALGMFGAGPSGGPYKAKMLENGDGSFSRNVTVGGNVVVSGGVKVGQADCTPGGGTLKWSGGDLWVCDDGGHKRKVSIGPPPPDAPNANCPTGTVGVSYSCSVTASNGATGFSASGLPAGLSINNSGSITGTPTQSGDFSVTLTASNDSDTGGSLTTTIKILPVVQCTGDNVPVGCDAHKNYGNQDAGKCYVQGLSNTGAWTDTYPAYNCHWDWLGNRVEFSCHSGWGKNVQGWGMFKPPCVPNSSGGCQYYFRTCTDIVSTANCSNEPMCHPE